MGSKIYLIIKKQKLIKQGSCFIIKKINRDILMIFQAILSIFKRSLRSLQLKF